MSIYYTSIGNIAMFDNQRVSLHDLPISSAAQLPISTGATAAPWPKWLANASLENANQWWMMFGLDDVMYIYI